jgi:hypothetical protein
MLNIDKPDYVLSLASAGFIVNVEVNVWSATKQDKGISEEVTDAYKADKSAGRFVKNLLAGDPTHKQLLNHRQLVYNWVNRRTFDWAGSSRYLPMANLEKFKNEFGELQREHDKLLDEFEAKYPDIVGAMQFKHGDMFDATEYPSVKEARSRFRMNLFISPVPTNDFRVAIADDIAEDLRKHYEQSANEKVQEIMRDASMRLVDYIKRIAHACRDVEQNEEGKTKRRPKVYEATLAQAKEQCELLKSFNLTNDAQLEEMRRDLMATIDGISAQDIRESDATRAHVKSEMDKIMSKFGLSSKIESDEE